MNQMNLDFQKLYEDDTLEIVLNKGEKIIKVKLPDGEARIKPHDTYIEVKVLGDLQATIQATSGNVFHIGLLPPI